MLNQIKQIKEQNALIYGDLYKFVIEIMDTTTLEQPQEHADNDFITLIDKLIVILPDHNKSFNILRIIRNILINDDSSFSGSQSAINFLNNILKTISTELIVPVIDYYRVGISEYKNKIKQLDGEKMMLQSQLDKFQETKSGLKKKITDIKGETSSIAIKIQQIKDFSGQRQLINVDIKEVECKLTEIVQQLDGFIAIESEQKKKQTSDDRQALEEQLYRIIDEGDYANMESQMEQIQQYITLLDDGQEIDITGDIVVQKIIQQAEQMIIDAMKIQSEIVEGKQRDWMTTYYESGKLQYDGQWKDDKPNGQGKYYHENENLQYEGSLINDQYNGYGQLYYCNGELKYDGLWLNGKRCDQGKSYYSNGKLQYDGIWNNGNFIGKHGLYHHSDKFSYNCNAIGMVIGVKTN